MYIWPAYVLLCPFLRCIFIRLEVAIRPFDFVTVQFSDAYICILPYIFDTCHLTRYLTDTNFILVVQFHDVVLS